MDPLFAQALLAWGLLIGFCGLVLLAGWLLSP